MARPQTAAQQLSIIKPRARLGLGVIAGLYLLLAGRLVYLQAARHTYFVKEADAYRVSHHIIPAMRGQILDRNGSVLAMDDTNAWAIYADPQEVQDIASTAQTLAPLLGVDVARLQALLTPRLLPNHQPSHYASLKRHVPDALGRRIQALNLEGIGVTPDTRRIYPDGSLGAQLLGFTDSDGNGIEGLEHSQEALLKGQDGLVVAEVDRKGRFIPGTERPGRVPQNGRDLVLTIDKDLQSVADTEVAKAVQEHHARNGVVVVLDPRTGEILALSNAPGYNPNTPRPVGKLDADAAKALEAQRRDHAVSDLYEPGSTLKTITASAILQEQGLGMMDKYVYCSPTLAVGNHLIHEAADALTRNLGDQNLRGVLRVSSNVGMAQFGLGLGARRLYEYEQKFGFLDKPDSGLPGEAKSWLQSPQAFNRFTGSVGWSKIQLANISFGQGISVTPLQLATAYAAVANGGTLMWPHIIHAVRDGGKETPVAPKAIRRVVSPEVAAAVRSMLGTVVQSGTGAPAQIAGYTVGGKTGSAQVAGAHGYEEGHFVASFVGMYPLSHPRLVILAAVFEPQGIHWGATDAAPVVHNIAKAAMLEMHIPPDDPEAVDWDDHLKGDYRAKWQARHQVAKRT